MHDFASKEDCDTKTPSVSTDCFGIDGKFYRYGCKEEGKVYTDTCTDDACSDCLDEWVWHNEEQDVCYFEGEVHYGFECTDLNHDDVYEPPLHKEGASIKTCEQLGWETYKVDGVCAESKIDGECHTDVTYEEAKKTCQNVGARLCTADELSNDAAKGSGCKGDEANTWTSTGCSDTGYTTQAGAKKGLAANPATCTEPETTAAVRCCGDEVNKVEAQEEEYPEGYTQATATDYDAANKACGGKGIKSYSCWTNSATGIAQRFACNGDDQVWAQSCGMDDSCSECAGDWFTYGEQAGKCYAEEGALYSYTCDA